MIKFNCESILLRIFKCNKTLSVRQDGLQNTKVLGNFLEILF